ncbi:MAG: 2,3-bisphosphoglycerate-independent phosphoglycerate mutase [Nitrospinae bacterium]|nr:2,3-bisphosphoglycerate-independent phosphoglycerate mutase [Nitrospinota bacterium]
MENKKYPPVTLCILDGWGHNPDDHGNAISAGRTPTFDYFNANFPPAFIHASGEYVGLPDGQMGNSEVGHLNIGAGRVIAQELPKISIAIKNGSFFKNPAIGEGIKKALDGGKAYHLIGLVSDGGVHSHILHLEALIRKCREDGMTERVFIHALMDGRDTPPNSGAGYMEQLVKMTRDIGVGKIATVGGRYYGMDRDNRWERVERAYKAIVGGEGVFANDPVDAIKASYGRGVTDEFIEPTVIAREGVVRDGDTVQFFNFRADRVRELARALSEPDFKGFDRVVKPEVNIYGMTDYSEDFHFPVAFETRHPRNGLGELFSKLGLRQFRTAETEKYAHVTFFFNGGVETEYEGETRRLVPSPKVATYDLKPEMSAVEVTDGVVEAVNSGEYAAVIVNLANGDMVGHTGVFPACVKAVETVDHCVGRMAEAVRKKGGWLVVTADHGNIEEKLDANGRPITAHNTNRVPFYVFGAEPKRLSNGDDRALCDVAPTVLKLMGIKQPPEMTGRPLF